jgi:hypothetical protein
MGTPLAQRVSGTIPVKGALLCQEQYAQRAPTREICIKELSPQMRQSHIAFVRVYGKARKKKSFKETVHPEIEDDTIR